MSGAMQDGGQPAPERRRCTVPEQARAGLSAECQRALEELSAAVEDALAYLMARRAAQASPSEAPAEQAEAADDPLRLMK